MSARLCRCFGAWFGLTLAWAIGVIAFIASRIRDQVSASEDLARDIAALDGGRTGAALVTQWEDMVALILEYRAAFLLEITLLPPLAIFAAAMAFLAWRRWSGEVTIRPFYSAAVRRAVPSRLM
jgi:hypothetical protein